MIKHYSLTIDTMKYINLLILTLIIFIVVFVFYPKSADESTDKPDSNINLTIKSSFDLKYDDCIKRLPALKEDFKGTQRPSIRKWTAFMRKIILTYTMLGVISC